MLSDDFTNLLDSSPLNTNDTVSEWLRRWTRNPLGSARVGSNPSGVDYLSRTLGDGHVMSERRRAVTPCPSG